MNNPSTLDPKLQAALRAEGIDIDLSLRLLDRVNSEELEQQSFTPVSTHKDILSLNEELPITDEQRSNLITTYPILRNLPYVNSTRTTSLSTEELEEIGTLLFPYYSCGILNGGSASSYADATKNKSFSAPLFSLYEFYFERFAPHLRGAPKALAPALYIKANSAPTFLAFKFRMLKTAHKRYKALSQKYALPFLTHAAPFFQMLSTKNSKIIRSSQESIMHNDFCASSLWQAKALDAEQSLIASITHSEFGRPRTIFQDAFGEPGRPYGLPGGHGQNFHVLRTIYSDLYKKGIRFVSIGNLDNLGYTFDPKTIAFLALSNVAALYEFSPRTELDKKGGILVANEAGDLSCADLGVAIDPERIADTDTIYFNCANGWFSLKHLLQQLDTIIAQLPIRVSDQKKDAGKYAQIELVTWEAMASTKPLKVLRVEKKNRLLSAKMLLETFILSGLDIEAAAKIFPFAGELHASCLNILEKYYGMHLST